MSRIPIPPPREAAPDTTVSTAPTAPRASDEPGRRAEPADDAPLGIFPRRVTGHARDGRRWEIFTDPSGVTVTTPRATVAEAHVWERDGQLTIEFWVDGADVPDELSAQLVDQAFAHPRVRARQPVLLCVPRRDGALLRHALDHVEDSRTRAAGMTCLVEGRVARGPATVAPRSG